jgi:phage-related protein
MESLGKAVLELVADIKPLAAGLEKGKLTAEEMASTTANGFRGGITKAAIPAAAAVTALVIGLHKSVDAAVEDQQAQARLASAYKAAGLNVNNYKDEIEKAEQSSAQLGFKSEDVKQALGSLVTATGSSEQAIKLLANAQDLARFKGISLESATKILTGTIAGSSRAARQLGIDIIPVTTHMDALKSKTDFASTAAYSAAKAQASLADKQATAAKTIDLVNQKLGGQASAFADTAAGAKDKMGAEINLLEINLGKVLIPILTKVATTLASFTQFLTEHAKVVKIVIAVIGTFATGILLYTGYVKLAAAAQALWNGIMAANPIGLLVIAIAALVVAFVELWQHSQTFRDIVKGVWSDVTDATNAFVSFFTTTVPNAFEAVKDWFSNTWTLVKGLITAPFSAAWSVISGIPGDITDGFGKIKKWFMSSTSWLGKTLVIQPFSDAWSTIKEIPGKVTDKFGDIAHWFKTASGWVTKRLITGPFSDAWDFIKGIPGDINDAFGKLGGWLKKTLGAAADAIVSVFKAPINAVIKLIDSIKLPSGIHIKTWHGIPDGFSIDWTYPFHIPMLAEGGIVTSPTLAMIGERGAEAVIPLDGKHGVGGGNITVHVTGWVGSDQDLATKLGRELEVLKRRGTTFAIT